MWETTKSFVMSPEPNHSYVTTTLQSLPGGGSSPATATPAQQGLAEQGLQILAPNVMARALAAVSYLGVCGLIVFAGRPRRTFPLRHSGVATCLHVARFLWMGSILLWWQRIGAPDNTMYGTRELGTDLGLLLLAGVPRPSVISGDLLPWILTPLLLTWLLSVVGMLLSFSGRTADLHAFANAGWHDVVQRQDWWRVRAAREREQARNARARQLERLQRTTKVMGIERVRQERIGEIGGEMQRLIAERAHIDQLLGLGEISRRRYDVLVDEIEADIANLRSEKNDLSQRSSAPRRIPEKLRVNRLERAPESDVETVAIVTPSGLPLFTYGSFHLDEVLVAGILSAFDSLSEEVFGSRVHKTQLNEGKVLHFAHGEYVVVLAIFLEDPSPRQVEQLRTMLQQFELANAGPLAREAYDTQYLHQVQIPFKVIEQ